MTHFFCALHCEAEPLIQHYKLSEIKQFDLFRVFQSKDKQISLIISGPGKLNMAAAVSYHHACLATLETDIRINVGVAGHKNFELGDAYLAHKITDAHDKTCWYPQIIFKSDCKSAELITLDEPSENYQTVLFDMEGSAFYQMAIRMGYAELTHCLKIVSDNPKQPTKTVNKHKIKSFITNHITTIENIIAALLPQANDLKEIGTSPKHYQKIIEKWHFTQTERIQLKHLLQAHQLRFSNSDTMSFLNDFKTGKQVLQSLKESLNKTEFVLYD